MDFNNLDTETIDLWELIDYIRTIRMIAEKVDKKVIDILGRSQIINYVSSVFANKFEEEIKYLNKERIESKFEGFAAQELGITREEIRKSGVEIPGV
ncbi:hypothetical protein GGP86_002806 [Salinibacter ruber]|uniref:hypothetical protein n=1 Tax=Salinibacter ruber TaxID=146919 RepID=UPI002168EC0E|nr:hypothetical protein [Salinibacter ruber]MCS3863017.1 hypothetical protein [Salinibacter ruber]